MAATITSRDWQEVDTSQAHTSSSANIQSDSLLTPLVGWAAFWTTFRVMFVEEYRENLDFAQKRRIVLFPLLLSLVTMIATIGLQFLVGEGAAQGQNAEQNFTWDQLRLFLHLPLLMFSLGMGSFAFLGRERVLSRTGAKNYLLATSASAFEQFYGTSGLLHKRPRLLHHTDFISCYFWHVCGYRFGVYR